MSVSVLVVTYNSEPHIRACLDSVFAQEESLEVIVVDNGSTDQTVEILRRDNRIRLIENRENQGFAKAVNQAAQQSRGRYLLLLNPDTVMSSGSLRALRSALDQFEDVAAVGPVSNHAAALQSIRHWYEFPEESLDPNRIESIALALRDKYRDLCYRSKLLSGFCLMIRTADFNALGGLDSDLILGFDDLDLCWKLALRGRALAVLPGSYVYHVNHQSFERGDPVQVESMHRRSLEAFSRKLADYYGGFEKIPSGRELWGIDWFTPVTPVQCAGEELPEQLRYLLEESGCVGVFSHGRCLDLGNRPIDPERCATLVWRLSSLELPGMALYLRRLRAGELRHLVVIFDNSWYQNPTGAAWSQTGVSPLDVRREILQAGFNIECMEAWKGAEQVSFRAAYGPAEIRAHGFLPEEILMASASRILLKAKACQESYHLQDKVSVIILALNQVEYTRKCIENLLKFSKQSIELILVNNGSTDGTRAYFDSVPGAKVIHNERNLGVAAGWNQGLRLATGDFVLILNNDTIPGPMFLENLVRCARNHPRAGIVVPRSNRIAGPQVVEGFSYASEGEIPRIAAEIQRNHELSAWEFPRLKGFCMLIPMSVVREIGPFDEQFGFGNFEDDDYSCRVRYAGYQLLVADDSFLFHFGSVSFRESGVDWDAQMRRNMELFHRKWSSGRVARMQSQSSELTVSDDLRVGESLESAGRLTEAFAVYRMALENANQAEEAGRRIRNMLAQHYTAESALEVLQVLRRKFPEVRSLRVPGWTDSALWREAVEKALESANWGEAFALVEERRLAAGDDFEVCNFLGLIRFYQGHYDEACTWFAKALRQDPLNQDALLNFYDACLKMGSIGLAESYIEKALAMRPEWAELRAAHQEIQMIRRLGLNDLSRIIDFRERNLAAENLIREGLYEKAGQIIAQILEDQPANYRALNNAGLIEWYSGRIERAFEYFSRSLEVNPWYIDALTNLYDCALLSGRSGELEPWLRLAEQADPGNAEIAQIRTELRSGVIPERLQTYFRKDQEKLRLEEQILLGQKLLEQQQLDSAVILFADLLKDHPDHIECLNGVGIAAYYRGDYEDAFALFKRAVEISPLDEDSLENLWDAAVRLGRTDWVWPILNNAVSVDPHLQRIARIVKENKR